MGLFRRSQPILMNVQPCPQRPATSGFTRAELLVILGTLAVLASLMLPRLARASGSGTALLCLDHHRQLALAWQAYAADNGGRVVNNYNLSDTMVTAANNKNEGWANNVLDWTRNAFNTNFAYNRTSRLWPYLAGDPEVFRCPADTYVSATQKAVGVTKRTRSYSMNGFMGRPYITTDANTTKGLNAYLPNYRQFLQTASIPKPSSMFVFLDEHPDSINEGLFLMNLDSPSSWGDQPASYHDGACSFSFADAHAELHAWVNPQTKIPVRYVYSSVPIPASARQDFLWVSSRTTVTPTTLALNRIATNRFSIVWAALPTNYALQVTTSLGSGNWAALEATPVQTIGQRAVEIETQEEPRFYRLKRP